jgi:predicted nucleic acid-binding Zn ribbon protein
MRIIVDMVCENGHRHEYWIDGAMRSGPCASCSGTATRVITPIRAVFKGAGWPDKDDKWAKKHEYHGDIAKASRGEEIG